MAVPRPPYQYRPYYRPYYYPRHYYPYYGYGYPYYGYPYYGYYGYPYYGNWGFSVGFYSPYYWGAYGQYPYPPYYYGPVWDNTGSARLQVTPRNAQVYIDGQFAGLVDEFDGYLQRLNVEVGQHELQLYLEGYRPFTQKVLFVRGGTLKITHAMQPLGPGEAPAQPPKPEQTVRARPYEAPGPGRQGPPPPRAGSPSEFGSLLLRVRPADADVIVDGEVWNAPQGQDQFVIELAEGPHRVEVRKEGFQTYSTLVRVRRGETARLNVSLTSGGLAGGL